jgi:DNA-binding transcriptional LysR family regulator
MRYFDPNLLRTLVAFADTGTMVRAAEIVGRTPSAITTQMQRLEEMIGSPIFETMGRRRVLTPVGEQLVVHARRILQENQAAWLKMAGAKANGTLRLGVTQDFVGQRLSNILKIFLQSYPRVCFELSFGRSIDLVRAYEQKKLDVLVSVRQMPRDDEIALLEEPMNWIGAQSIYPNIDEDLPLALLNPPCGFRESALQVLEENSLPYRMVATSPSLAGIETVVDAGLALTVRTTLWLKIGRVVVPKSFKLPTLPNVVFSICVHKDGNDVAHSFSELLKNEFNFYSYD